MDDTRLRVTINKQQNWPSPEYPTLTTRVMIIMADYGGIHMEILCPPWPPNEIIFYFPWHTWDAIYHGGISRGRPRTPDIPPPKYPSEVSRSSYLFTTLGSTGRKDDTHVGHYTDESPREILYWELEVSIRLNKTKPG